MICTDANRSNSLKSLSQQILSQATPVLGQRLLIGLGFGLTIYFPGFSAQAGTINSRIHPAPVLAQASAPEQPPLDLAVLQAESTKAIVPGSCPVLPEVVTVNTICQSRLTIPSLWWAKEQFGGRLLENWLAYAEEGSKPRRIDLVVNPQVWSLLNYVERYAFTNHFGSSARSYRYNTRIFNRQGGFLAAYTCDFNQLSAQSTADTGQTAMTTSSTTGPCKVLLNTSRRDGLRGRPPGL